MGYVTLSRSIYSRKPVDSILEAVLTVSPKRQYRGIFTPTTPAQHGPVVERKKAVHRLDLVQGLPTVDSGGTQYQKQSSRNLHHDLLWGPVFCTVPKDLKLVPEGRMRQMWPEMLKSPRAAPHSRE